MRYRADAGCAGTSRTGRVPAGSSTGCSTGPGGPRRPATPRAGPSWCSRDRSRPAGSGDLTPTRRGWPAPTTRVCSGAPVIILPWPTARPTCDRYAEADKAGLGPAAGRPGPCPTGWSTPPSPRCSLLLGPAEEGWAPCSSVAPEPRGPCSGPWACPTAGSRSGRWRSVGRHPATGPGTVRVSPARRRPRRLDGRPPGAAGRRPGLARLTRLWRGRGSAWRCSPGDQAGQDLADRAP